MVQPDPVRSLLRLAHLLMPPHPQPAASIVDDVDQVGWDQGSPNGR